LDQDLDQEEEEEEEEWLHRTLLSFKDCLPVLGIPIRPPLSLREAV